MGTQTSVAVQTQTSPGLLTPGLLRRAGNETVFPSGNRVSIVDDALTGRSRGDQAAASLNGQRLILDQSGNQAIEIDRAWPTSIETAQINPATAVGQKLFLESSKGLPPDQRLNLTQANGKKIHRFLRANEANIRSSTEVQIYDVNGRTQMVRNILTQYHSISIDDCIKEGRVLFQEGFDPSSHIPNQKGPFPATTLNPAINADHQQRYFNIVDNNVAVKLIQHTLTYDGWNKLNQKASIFTYVNSMGKKEFHAKTMLFLLQQRINPTTETSMDGYLQKLLKAKLSQFGNDVSDLVVYLTENYTILFDHGQAPPNIRRIVLDALGSGQNSAFNSYVSRLEDNFEMNGVRVRLEADQIMVLAEEKFLDMKEQGVWNQVDPRDAEIMALVTQVKELQEARNANANASALATANGNGSGTSSNLPFDLNNKDTWTKIKVGNRKVFEWRTKYQGDSLMVLGKLNLWCPHCKMYGWHKPEKCNKLKSGETSDNGNSNSSSGGQNAGDTKLNFTKELKSVLSTQLCISDEDIDKLFERAGAPGN